MRNLKNLNHWIAELRDLAKGAKLFDYDEDTKESFPMPLSTIKSVFTKRDYKESFDNGDTPQEAFDITMDEWHEALNEICKDLAPQE